MWLIGLLIGGNGTAQSGIVIVALKYSAGCNFISGLSYNF